MVHTELTNNMLLIFVFVTLCKIRFSLINFPTISFP